MEERGTNNINTSQAKTQIQEVQTHKTQAQETRVQSKEIQTHKEQVQTQKTQVQEVQVQAPKMQTHKAQTQEIQIQKVKVSRLAALDTIRGITLLSMILYHTCWDLVFLFGKRIAGYTGTGGYLWQQSICWTFILLSGFCWSLGHHHLKRGLLVFGSGLLITVVTLLAMPESRVVFGVLTLIGSCMLLLIPIEKFLLKIRTEAGLAGSFLLFLLFRNVNTGYLGFEKWNIIRLPDGFYRNLLTTYLGFPQRGFFSTDYFSLLPWFFLFVTGFYLYQLVQKKDMTSKLFSWRVPVFDVIGRHSLLIYLLHQPIVFGISWLFFQM
jgi:uncharacterized membrane protein